MAKVTSRTHMEQISSDSKLTLTGRLNLKLRWFFLPFCHHIRFRYKHNKTRRIGTIHHIPLKVHGYAETSEFPVSTDTERPVIGGHHHPPKMQSHRPKKQVGGGVKNGNQPSSRHPFKAVKNAMETIPHAIHHLPNLMQSLVSNHASWMDKVWPNEDGSTKKSFDAITSLQKKDIDQE